MCPGEFEALRCPISSKNIILTTARVGTAGKNERDDKLKYNGLPLLDTLFVGKRADSVCVQRFVQLFR